ncbi:MAG: efflux RND transporter periplasmic adaptor subunit [Sandaracinaceae bacterium]
MTVRRGLAAASAVLALACGGGQEETHQPLIRSVRVERVGQSGGVVQRVYSGVVESGEQSRLSFRVSGTVARVLVNVGDEVEEGQLLAELDRSDYALQLSEAQSSVAQARAQSIQAEAEYNRVVALYESQSVSASELDAARSARDSARSTVSSLGSRVALARNQLEYTRLTSPAAGTILEVEVETSENVQPGQTVIVLQSGTQLEVRVAMPEAVINRVERRSPVEVTVPSLPGQTFAGTVFEVGAAMESATFPVTIRLEGETSAIRPGMAAEVAFAFAESAEDAAAIRVPSVAVAEDREGRFVFVVEGEPGQEGEVHRREVVVGDLTVDGLEITEGLEIGELLVTAGVSRLDDRQTVIVPANVAPPAAEPVEAAAAGPEEGSAP